jgi:hypothetical protein
MAWEIEHDFVDEQLHVHRFQLVNNAVKDAYGLPSRRTYDYLLGSGHDGQSCPHCGAAVRVGHVLQEDGTMKDRDGNVVTARARAEQHIKELNAHQNRVAAYVRHHRTKRKAIA